MGSIQVRYTAGRLIDPFSEDPTATLDRDLFLLEKAEGTEYLLSRREGLKSVTDLNGNTCPIPRKSTGKIPREFPGRSGGTSRVDVSHDIPQVYR